MSPARIKGTKLSLTIGTTEIHEEGTSVVMDSEEANGDVTTFADAEAGGARQHFFQISATQSLAAESFWRMLWANTGETAAFVYRPHGNPVATADQPHFTGTLKIGPKPALGGSAGTNSTFTFDTRLDIEGVPVLDNGSVAVPVITLIEPEAPDAGALVTISGSRFSAATSVTVDGDVVPFSVISDGTIAAYIPDDATGEVDVIVVNADGSSTAYPVTIAV